MEEYTNMDVVENYSPNTLGSKIDLTGGKRRKYKKAGKSKKNKKAGKSRKSRKAGKSRKSRKAGKSKKRRKTGKASCYVYKYVKKPCNKVKL
tara:strand:+ start:548 stop:823 length:276 start_codon:yes stop_codon:yes gene_type:complete